MEAVWCNEWHQLLLERVQWWILRIICYIQMVVKLYGGNEYREGTTEEVVLVSRVFFLYASRVFSLYPGSGDSATGPHTRQHVIK